MALDKILYTTKGSVECEGIKFASRGRARLARARNTDVTHLPLIRTRAIQVLANMTKILSTLCNTSQLRCRKQLYGRIVRFYERAWMPATQIV